MSLDDPGWEPLLEASRAVDLVIGAVLRGDDFRYYNAVLYLSGGEVRHVHRKVYLPTYGMFDEQRYFAPGDRVRAFSAGQFSTGLLVCEDMWHMSSTYLLFVQGVHLLICASSSPGRGVLATAGDDAPGTAASWGDLCRTVAEFNVCYVAYCNRVGFEDGIHFWGRSAILAPNGQVVAQGGGEEELVFGDIDLREVDRQRLATPLLRDEKVEFTLRELERITRERTDGPY